MDETDAIDALETLGLTGYEAKVFVALQKLGSGSASDVDRITDVPRSQVYGAAEKLEERGLVELQQSNPIRYRAVDLDEARERLRTRYEEREQDAFDYLQDARAQRHDAEERQEDVWTLHGRDSVTARVIQLAEQATDSIVYAGTAEDFDDELVATLADRRSAGVDVTVLSGDPAVHELLEDSSLSTVSVPPTLDSDDQQTGRILVVDDETVLLSVLGDEELPELRRETAIWSAETGFASVIVRMFYGVLDEHIQR